MSEAIDGTDGGNGTGAESMAPKPGEHPWSLAAIARMTGATVAGISPEDWRLVNSLVLSGVTIDSRDIAGGEMFVPLPGTQTDGHRFISDAFQAGAGAALAQRSWWSRRKAARALGIHLLVDDPLVALQQWAAELRAAVDPRVVAVTGSSGKTTTKEMILALLRPADDLIGTAGNFNNQIGVPLTLLTLRTTTRRAILELGTNQPGEIAALSKIVRPHVAVITSIGQAHGGFLGGPAGVLQEKLSIVEGLDPEGILVYPDDHEPLAKAVAERWTGRTLTFGFSETAGVRGFDLDTTLESTNLRIDGLSDPVRMSLLGEGSARSALAAVAALRALGEEKIEIGKLATLEAAAGRMQVRMAGGVRWLLDMYNASPEATLQNLGFLERVPCDGRKLFVFGGMKELGDYSEDLHRQVGEAAGFCDAGVFFGEEARRTAPVAQAAGINQVLWCTEHQEAVRFLRGYLKSGDLVLVKGSRSAALEQVVEALGVLKGAPESAGEG